ncbi:hypothetical protein STEG23_026933 [Scotinomys teguina]
MTVTPLGQDQDCSLKNREPDVLVLLVPGSWILDPGGWSKAAAVGLYFIFPGLCTLSLVEDSNPLHYGNSFLGQVSNSDIDVEAAVPVSKAAGHLLHGSLCIPPTLILFRSDKQRMS